MIAIVLSIFVAFVSSQTDPELILYYDGTVDGDGDLVDLSNKGHIGILQSCFVSNHVDNRSHSSFS